MKKPKFPWFVAIVGSVTVLFCGGLSAAQGVPLGVNLGLCFTTLVVLFAVIGCVWQAAKRKGS